MQDSKDYFELYYDFVESHRLASCELAVAAGWGAGRYTIHSREGAPLGTVTMTYDDMAFADRLYQIVADANSLPGVSMLAAWSKDTDGEPRATPAPPAEPVKADGEPRATSDTPEEPVKEPDWTEMFISAGKGIRWVRLLCYLRDGCSWSDYSAKAEDNLERLVLEVIGKLAKSRKHAALFDCKAARIQEIVSRVSRDIREHAADDFFGKVLPVFVARLRKESPGDTGIFTSGNACRAAYRFLYGRIRNLALKYARAYMYTYGPNLAPEEMSLPEDNRWAESHKVLPMLPAILLDIDNAVRFRMMFIRFGSSGHVTYSRLGMHPVVTEDSLKSDYPALNRLAKLMVEEIVRKVRPGNYFDPRDTVANNGFKELVLADFSLKFLYRKLSGGLRASDVALLREAVDAQFAAKHNVLTPRGRDDAHLRLCMAFLRKLARQAVIRAIHELKNGGSDGASAALAAPLKL